MKKFLTLCLLALATAAQAGTWSTASWTGDATTTIASPQTQWAYHFGAATAATVNSVSVPGIATATVSNTNLSATFGSVVATANNNISTLGGTGSGVLGSSFVYQGSPGSVTVNGLVVGLAYKVSFFGVGYDNVGVTLVTFASSGDNLLVDESAFGLGNGVRVDYSFTANATTRAFTLTNSNSASTWHQHAIALRLLTSAPTVTTPTSTSVAGTTATLGGNVTDDGLATITERGVVLSQTSLNGNPLINGSNVTKLSTTGQTGVFTVSATALAPGIAYTFKAFATNAQGTSYSSASSFTTLSNNAALSALSLTEGTLAPVFAGGTLSYTTSVAATSTTIQATPTVAQAGATVTVNGASVSSSSDSNPIALTVGTNPISVIVTAPDGTTTRTYSIVVTRTALPTVTTPTSASVTGNSATLGGTVTDDGFAPITERGIVYALSATTSDPQIGNGGVTKLPASSGTLGGFTLSASSLTPGQSYSYKAYATNSEGTGYSAAGTFVTLSNNAALSGLVLSVGTLSPSFNGSTLSYTASVSNTTTSTTVKPTLAQANATQTANGQTLASATFSASLSLNVGSNPVSIVVTAQDGITTRTYSLAVTRLPAPEINVTGNGISISSGDFLPSSADHTDFGAIKAAPGNSVTRTFTLQNLGTADLLLNRTPKVAITGPDAGDFVVVAQPPSPVTVAMGSTTFDVTFTPSTGGARTASLTIGSNDADEGTYSFGIKGVGKWSGDDFADAQPLSGTLASATATNMDATSEPGEPGHGADVSGSAYSSMWWVWTAPASGSATVSLLASDYDTVLSIYKGSSLGSLTRVAANDDFGLASQSQVIFTTVAGTTYHIAIDGYNGQTGSIDLQLELLLVPNVSVSASPGSMAEGAAGTLAYTFTRDGDATSAFTANFSVGGTATFATDYTQSGAASFNATTGTVAFAANQVTATVLIDPIADSAIEANETVELTLTSGTGYVVGSTPIATATINDDDSGTVLSSSINPSVLGQSITLSAAVTALSGTRTGLVTFKEGATTLGTATPVDGIAILSLSSLSVATHSLTAEYAGDATANASVSNVINQVVNKAATSTQLFSSRNPSTLAASVTFTAVVTTNLPGSGTPSGSVTFKDGGTVLGIGTLDGSGVATLSTAGLSTGSHSITAEYGGSGSQVASTSAAISQLVNPTLTLAPSTLPAGTVTVPYNQVLTASNGTGLRSLSVTGFSAGGTGLSAPVAGFNTLTLAGTATAAGTVSFTAQVTDEGGGTLSVPYSIQIENVPPTLSITNATTNEDTPTASGLVVTHNIADGSMVTHVKITAITNGTLFQNDGSTAIASNSFITFAQASAGMKFSPAANFFGTASISIQASTSASDAGLGGSVVTASITVNPVADTPALSAATTNEDTQSTTGLVVTRNAADSAEVTHFKLTAITNGSLFQNDGSTAIASNAFITFVQASAGLKFSPAANFNGNGSVTLQASTSAFDAGIGGSSVTATIIVNAVNDAPSFTKGADQIRPFANTSAQTVTGWATALSKGPADEALQSLTFNITNNSNPALFTVAPSIASDGTLSYTPAGIVGSATLTVTLSDNGGGTNTSPSQSFVISVEPLPDYTVDVSATSIVVTDIGGHADTLIISEPIAGNIKFAAAGRTLRINDGALLSGDTGSIALAGITAIIVHGGDGNDLINVGGFTASMPSLTINGDGGDDAVNLQGNLSFLANASLDLVLSNDPGTAGIDTVRVAASASIITSGTGSITMKVSGDIGLATGSTLQTANGGITLHAARATGSAAGIDINGAQVHSTGAGVVELIGSGILGSGSMVGVAVRNAGSISGGTSGITSISGTGGTGVGSNVGVLVTGIGSSIATAGSHLAITGTTTATGATNDNNGISIKASASVSATGAGKITLIGTGAQATGTRNYGVHLDTASKVTSENGDISISGTARSTAGDFPIGIIALNNAEIASTGSGGIALVGIGAGTTSSNSADGILLITTNGTVGPRISTNGGLIRVEGRAGTSATGYGLEAGAGATLVGGPIQVFANQFVIDTGANPSTLNAGGESVSLAPTSSGVAVVLGGSDSTTQLGLTDAELDRISCGTLVISTSTTPGDTLTVSAPISRSVAANSNELATTNLQLNSSGDLTLDQPINLGGGSLQLSSGSPLGLIKPHVTSTDFIAGTTTLAAGNLGLTINGTVVNTLYDQLNIIGSLDVTGCRLALNGSLIPAAGSSYTLINNDGGDAIIGTFVGLPQGTIFSFNGIAMRISYTGGSGNDVTIEPSNTAPTISDVASSSTLEDTATGAIAITIGDGESVASLLTLSAISSNPTLVPNLPASFTFSGTGASRTIIISPAANQFGTATITLTVNDGNLTASDTFELTVNAVADTPAITNTTTNEDTQSTSGLVVTRNVADSTEVTHFKITSITNGTLFQANGSTAIASNDFITFAQSNAGLKFSPAANSISSGSFTIQASTSNSDAGLGGSTVIATITVNAIADTPSITSATTNEDTQTINGLIVSRSVADGTEVTHFKVTAITNGTLFQANGSTAIANGDFITFAQANAGLKFSPTANFFGNGSITILASTSAVDAGLGGGTVTANIAVNAIADTPAITSTTTNEDTQTTSGLVVTRNIADSSEVTHFKVTAITNGSLFQANGTTAIAANEFITFAQANAGLKFTPSANSISNGSITIQASTSAFDAGLGGSAVTATITVNAIADTPSITSATTNEDTQTTTGLVVSRSVADSTEVTHFKVTAITNGTLFQNDGSTAIAANDFITFAQANAGLKFSPMANFFGNGSITIQASTSAIDAGLGGSTVTANITINPIADTPAITSATTDEDIQTSSGLVVTRNVADDAEVTHFKITAITNGTLFQNNGSTAIANNAFITFTQANAGLKFSPSPNAIGSGSFIIQASTSALDTGLGGSTVVATISLNSIADTPSITNATTNEDTQSTTGLIVSRNIADGPEVTHFKITAITNGSLFQNDGITAIGNNAYITFAQANVGLKFTPNADFHGSGSVTIQASTSGLETGLGGSTVTALITVNSVNDVPSFTKGANLVRPFANTTAQSVTGWATALRKGPTDESAQSLSFSITTNSNAALFTVAPSISSDGTLTYTPAGTVGTATLTVTLSDDGGTAFGGVDTSAAQSFTITVSDSPDYVITTAGSSLTITDTSGNSDSLVLSEPVAGSLLVSVSGRSFSVNQDYSSVDDSGAISLSGITRITINAAAGSDTIQVNSFTSPLPGLIINGGTGDDTVLFAGDIAIATDASFGLDLQKDDAAPGSNYIRILADADLAFSGSGGLLAKSNSFTMLAGATITTAAGDILITGSAGAALPGVLLGDASSLTSTTGSIVLTGTSDDSTGNEAIVLHGTASLISPSITLIGDSIALDPTSAQLDSGSAGSVTLRQQTAATPINLGVADTASALGFTDAELDCITAATLTIGNTDSGLITISTVISPASYKTLALGHDVVFTATSGLDSDVGPTVDVYEKITIIGTATIAPGATLQLTSVGGYTAARAATFTFLENDGSDPIMGSFTGPSLTDFLGSALIAARTYVGGDGNDLVITNALPAPAPLLSTSLGAGVVNPSTGLIEQTVRVTNASAVSIDGVRLTLTNLVAPYTLQNRTHPSLPFIEVCTPLAAGESMDIYVAIYTANRILPNWVPNYQATPLVALALSPTTLNLPSAATSYAITVTTAGSWSVVESLPWVSVSTLDGRSNGYLIVTVQANTSLLPRSGVIKIGCREHQLTQAGVLPPHIDTMPGNYDTIVGDNFRLVLPVLNLPATFKTLGMPPGLKLDQTTGVIFGQPTTAGFYALSIFGRNASGVTNTVNFSITVAPLKSGIVGTFQGLIQRSASVYVGPLPGMGARIQLTVASTGAITGKITDGGTSKAITGQLHVTLATADSPTATVRLPATTISPEYILNLLLSHSGNDLTGTIALASSTAVPAAIEAWRNSWHVKAPAQLATAYKVRHNFAIENQGVVGPQGFGFGSFSVTESTGALSIAGKLPDGSALLCSTFIGASGQVLLYQSLYGNKGSCLGKIIVDPKTTALADNTLAGALTWMKPASAPAAKDTLYPGGFGPIALSVEGGSYTPPAAGFRVMNLPLVPAPGLNATQTFSDGGLLAAFEQDLRISANGLVNTATLPLYNSKLVPNPNPQQVAITTFTAATGGFVGRFTLLGTTAAVNRTAPFCGQIVTTSTGPIGLGYFLLPSVPTGTQTVSNSPKLSGSVELRGR